MHSRPSSCRSPRRWPYGRMSVSPPRATAVDGDRRRTLDPTAVVLGMIDGMPLPEASAELRAGSRLLLYTDGITEAENGAGEQLERLESLSVPA
jgi:sigma-B regulation protein RsbU (phosphoserine phosphatase)